MTAPNDARPCLIVGAPKSGTTSLFRYVSQHPAVCGSRDKESRFFEFGGPERIGEWWERQFSHRDGEDVLLEASPYNLFVPYVPERIAEAIPDARIIAILRHPVERAHSDWWMFYTRQLDEREFPEAIQRNHQRVQNAPLAESRNPESLWKTNYEAIHERRTLELRPYLECGHYAQQLQRYREHFPDDRIKVLFLDDLNQDPPSTVRTVWDWLGLDTEAPLRDTEAHNAAFRQMPEPMLAAIRVANRLRIPTLLPDRVKGWIRNLLSGGSRPAMEPETRAWLEEYYQPHNERLRSLLDRGVPDWLAEDADTEGDLE